MLALLQPPVDARADETAAWVWIALMIAGALFAVAYLTRVALRERSALPLALLVGGGVIAVPLEPVTNVLGAIWYPSNTPLAGELMGYTYPPYAFIGYMFAFPLGLYLCARVVAASSSAKTIAVLWAALSVGDAALEMTFAQFDAIIYFGDNPTRILGLPLYAIVVNGSIFVVGGYLVAWAAARLRGREAWWVAAAVPCGLIMYYVGTQWPVYIALQSSAADVVVWLAAAATIALALASVVAASRLAHRGPTKVLSADALGTR